MRWQGRRGSRNVEDRRGMGGAVAGGGIGVVVVALIVMLLGGDPRAVLDGGGGGPVTAEPRSEAEDSLARMVSVVLADTEEVWERLFREETGRAYEPARLVLFTGAVDSGCGFAQAAMGPFYCPLDQSVYIDLGFYDQLHRMGGRGDLAQAYVIAHEVGHHVQTLLGVSGAIRERSRALPEAEANRLSVRQELQADCFAGVWAHRAEEMFGILEQGDVQEALDAAAAVGDDRLQKAGRGAVVPESFTHGTAEQRMRWFMRGFRSGRPGECDTFSASEL